MVKKIKKLLRKRLIVVLVFAGLLIWLALVNPASSSPVLLLVPFILLFVLFYSLIDWLIQSLAISNKSNRRQSAVVWLLSLIADVILVLSSLGQLELKDLLTLLALVVVGLIYIFKLVPVNRAPREQS